MEGGGVVGGWRDRYGGVAIGILGMLGEGEGGRIGRRASKGREVGGFCEGHISFVFCGREGRGSRRVVLGDETVGFRLHKEFELESSHG